MFGKIEVQKVLVDVDKQGCIRFGYTDLNQDQLIKASGRISLNKLPVGIGEDDKWQILDGDSLILTVKLDGDMKVSLRQVKKLFENMVA